jgi:Na+/proline symporter
MLVFPDLNDIAVRFPWVERGLIGHDMAYPAMLTFLPPGFLGLIIAGLLAAYVSTLSTHLNWGTSYLVHDLYRRFVRAGASEAHYVLVGRVVTALLMVLAALLTFVLDSARQAFELMMAIGAGTGLLYLLRWFWWRVTAWSEIGAMASSFVLAVGFVLAPRLGFNLPAHVTLLTSVAITTVVWVAVAYLGPQTNHATLVEFCRLVRPAGPGWKAIRAETGLPPSPDNLPTALLGWVFGCGFVYAALFGSGTLLYGHYSQFTLWLVVFLVCGVGLLRTIPRVWAGEPES